MTTSSASPAPNKPTRPCRNQDKRAIVRLLAATGAVFIHGESTAADLVIWDFSGLSGISASAPATSIDPAVQSAGDIARGSGLSAESISSALSSSNWTAGNSPDPNDYYEFSVTPAPGNLLDLDTLHFAEARSGTGIGTFEVRSSLDNFSSTVDAVVAIPDDTSNRNHSIPLGSAFDSVSTQVVFRIYGYAAEGSTGTWRLRNHTVKSGLVLEGTAIAAAGALSVSITPDSFPESSGNPAAGGTVTRTGDLSNPLTVTLSSSDTSEATVPATVEIPADQSAASFNITAIDDMLPDGDVSVTISATATGYTAGAVQITIDDDGDLPPLVINEVDCDTSGSDTAEFIELFNNSNENLTLDGLVVVLFNGSVEGDPSYRTIDLSGHIIPANGFVVIGNTGVPNQDISLPIGSLRNGADAVAIYLADATTIPNGTPVASITSTLVDAVVYDTNDLDDVELIAALTPDKPQLDEGTGAIAEANSISRVPDGGAAFETTLFVAQPPTPGTTNQPAPADDYDTWAGNHVENQSPNADYDGDGIANGIEYFMGSAPDAYNANPVLVAGTMKWPRAAGTTIDSFRVEVSTDLATWEDAALNHAEALSISDSEVSFTPPPGSGSLFVRLSVTP